MQHKSWKAAIKETTRGHDLVKTRSVSHLVPPTEQMEMEQAVIVQRTHVQRQLARMLRDGRKAIRREGCSRQG